jgi:hypothetical protein
MYKSLTFNLSIREVRKLRGASTGNAGSKSILTYAKY